jgi:predicted regulator of Ras-like GTPase activity (Roadblock/LC7/MglB family)
METATLTDRIERCEKILRENANSQVFAPLADALRIKGDLDQAFRVCRQGLRLHPDFGAGHLVMAKINFERKMFDWAEQELELAAKLDGETRVTEQLRMEILIAKGEYAAAELLLKKLRSSGANPLYVHDLRERLKRLQSVQLQRKIAAPPPQRGVKDRFHPPEEQRVDRIKTPLTLSSALELLMMTAGVEGVVCAKSDGTFVDQRGVMRREPSETSAFSVEMCRVALSDTSINYFGHPQQITVETEDIYLVILRFKRYNLVLFCDRDVSLGSLRLKLDEVFDNLHDD